MILIKKFEFDAAHHLTKYNGKCERPHGHTYQLVVKLKGTPDEEDMIYDFVALKRIIKDNILVEFDHNDLNTFMDNPSAENIALYIWDKLKPLIDKPNCHLHEIEVWETKDSGVVYRGE